MPASAPCYDSWSKKDCYAVVTLGSASKQTHVNYNTYDPVWNQVYEFGCQNRDDLLTFVVKDYDNSVSEASALVYERLLP